MTMITPAVATVSPSQGPAPPPRVIGDGDGGEAEHQVRDHRPGQAADQLRGDQHQSMPGGDLAENAFGEGDEGVERGRHRLEDCDQDSEAIPVAKLFSSSSSPG